MSLLPGLDFLSWGKADHYSWPNEKYFSYYGLNYAHRGKVYFAMDGESPTLLESPVAWICFPGPKFRYGDPNRNSEWEHRWVSFQGRRADDWVKSKLFPIQSDTAVFPIEKPDLFRLRFDELHTFLGRGDSAHDYAVHTLEGLLLELQIDNEHPKPEARKIKRIIQKIRASPENHWNFEAIAQQEGFSYSHFRRIFKKIGGLPPHHFLQAMRIERSAIMLRDPKLSLREAADHAGFEDFNYFCKLFKKRFGFSPGVFRKEFLIF